MIPGRDCRFAFTIWTWLAESLLKPVPFRLVNPRLRPKVTFWPDCGVPKGNETIRNAPGVANRHENCD